MFLIKQQLIIILHVAVCLQEKACEIVSLVRRRQLSIKEAWKAVKHHIKDPIAVSYFFFAQASALVPCGFATHLPRMLLIYCDSTEK